MNHDQSSELDDGAGASPSRQRACVRRRGWVVGAVALTALTLASGITGDRGHAPWQPACADGVQRAA
ncbi:MAG: hypothetical protein ABI696_14910 [Rubrivivax sp.]